MVRRSANTQFYVVDRNDALVPQGGVGELLIGGDGVAVGYWDMPALTRERFVRPIGSATCQARSCTGPATWSECDRTANFNISAGTTSRSSCAGSGSNSVRSRRFCPGTTRVRRAIAIPAESAPGEIAILAYVTLHGDEAARRERIVEALRADVAAMLPSYMRPQNIIVLDAIPLLPNGKIDRKALPLPGSRKRPATHSSAAVG